MLYCAEVGGKGLDKDYLLSRDEVYSTCIQFTGDSAKGMDSLVTYLPEHDQYRVAEISIGTF